MEFSVDRGGKRGKRRVRVVSTSKSSQTILHNWTESMTFRGGQAQGRKKNLALFNRILDISHMEFHGNVQDSKVTVKYSPILVLVLTTRSVRLTRACV